MEDKRRKISISEIINHMIREVLTVENLEIRIEERSSLLVEARIENVFTVIKEGIIFVIAQSCRSRETSKW